MVTRAQEFPPFASRMKTAREQLGLSQMGLGVRAGIDEFSSSARINQYERGKHAPDFLNVRNLAKVLDVPTAYFYAEDDNLAELIMLFGKLKVADRKTLRNFADSLIAEYILPWEYCTIYLFLGDIRGLDHKKISTFHCYPACPVILVLFSHCLASQGRESGLRHHTQTEVRWSTLQPIH